MRGRTYPVVLPSWRDPRFHLAMVFVCLHTIGQVFFHFRLSIPQILAALLTAGILEFGITFWRSSIILWPASALLSGNGIAFIMRIPGTEHGDWWSLNGVWVYVGVAAFAVISKYLIKFRGRHIFNPSNLALVLCFLILGSSRAEPLEFWWGPVSPALALVLGTIVCGALLILSRVGLLAVASLFWVSFCLGIGLLALSGHAMSANWHIGPVTDDYFWRVLITSPEVFIFLSFMITDPKTVPRSRVGRRVYAVSIGLLATLLIAPQQTEFGAKVALLGSLTIICAARPMLILARELWSRRRAGSTTALPTFASGTQRWPALGAVGVAALAGFAGVVVLAGTPARAGSGASAAAMSAGQTVELTVASKPGVDPIDEQLGRRIAGDAIDDLGLAARALRTRNAAMAAECAGGNWLADLQQKIARPATGAVTVPTYQVDRVHLELQRAVGQEPPRIVATLTGMLTPHTYATPTSTASLGETIPFTRSFDLAMKGDRFLIVDDHAGSTAAEGPSRDADTSKGTGSFTAVRLANVAQQAGLRFQQGAFRFGASPEAAPMMGGGLCWLDYDNDGWLDLFAVNSYSDQNIPDWQSRGGLPSSGLFHNVRGKFTDASRASDAALQVKGTGCVAADFDGDGFTDLFMSTAASDQLLWNNGDGTFTEGARASGIVSFGWHSGAAVSDVNGDGRPDLFVAGYTDVNAPVTGSMAGFPTNFQGVRDLLFLNEGEGPNGHARFREVGAKAGLETKQLYHGLGAVFTDVNADGRPDLYVANDEDPNYLYLNEPYPGGAKADPAGLGFRLRERAKAESVDDPNAGMGVAVGDYNGDARQDLFITNSRGQDHAAYASAAPDASGPAFDSEIARFATALHRTHAVGWGDSWVDLDNDGDLDLIVANGAIPVTNLAKDAQPLQVLQNLDGDGKAGAITNASGVIASTGLPPIVGRGLAAADFDNDGHVDVAINSIGGPLVLLQNTGAKGNWLEVALAGFHPGAVVTAELADGRRLVREIHAGSSYLSSEDPRIHLGLGDAATVKVLVVRFPDGTTRTLRDVAANRVVTVRNAKRS